PTGNSGGSGCIGWADIDLEAGPGKGCRTPCLGAPSEISLAEPAAANSGGPVVLDQVPFGEHKGDRVRPSCFTLSKANDLPPALRVLRNFLAAPLTRCRILVERHFRNADRAQRSKKHVGPFSAW